MESSLRSRLAGVQERVEQTTVGKTLISVLAVGAILIGVVWSLPESPIKRSVVPLVRPAAIVTGLDQAWSVFAPDPPRTLNTFEIHVVMEDQSMRPWTVPHGHPIYGQYSWYRFQKLKEWILAPNSGVNVNDFVHWVVRQVTEPGEKPVFVELVSRVEALPPPGTDTEPVVEFHVVYQEYLAGRP